MKRIRNWDVELVHYANSVLGESFKWGRTDCFSVVRNGLRAMYGRDLFRGVGTYRTTAKAKAFHKAHAGIPLKEYGFKKIARNFCQAGDVIIWPNMDPRGFPQFGIVVGGKILVSKEGMGPQVIALPTLDWPVGTKIMRPPA